MKFDNYQFRCSALGKIVPKSGVMTDGIKTYLTELFIGETYGIQKEITSKYFEKGIICEQDGRDFLKKILYPKRYVVRNREHFYNDYIKGTPDVIMNDYHYDIKNAYDLFTFGKAHLSWEYKWQIKGYTMLLNGLKGRLFYLLADMPDMLMADEEKKMFYQGKFITTESNEYQKAIEELHKKFTYSDISLERRFKIFEVPYTDEDENIIISSVQSARKFLNKLQLDFESNIERNIELINSVNITM